MGADRCIVYIGVRRPIRSDEVELFELRRHLVAELAMEYGLDWTWGRFGGEPDAYEYLLGRHIGTFGPEASLGVELPVSQLEPLLRELVLQLSAAGIAEPPGRHIVWELDL